MIVGFAAETASGAELVALGRAKLAAKGADLIVANDVVTARRGPAGFGFGQDASRRCYRVRAGPLDLGVAAKSAVAAKLVDAITDLLALPTADR